MTHATRVLGVDPGLTRCGVAVIEGSAGQKVSLLHVGVFRTDPGEAIEQRLISIERDMESLVDELEPDVVAVERVSVSTTCGRPWLPPRPQRSPFSSRPAEDSRWPCTRPPRSKRPSPVTVVLIKRR